MSDLSRWYQCECGVSTNYQPNDDTSCRLHASGHVWTLLPLTDLQLAIARAERAEAEVHRLKGLLLSETLCTMHYCERHGMAYQRPRRAQPVCPHCEAERAEAEVARLREALAGHACALECCVCGKTTEEPFLKARCECGESYNGPSLAAALADSEKEET